jgi:hypothetical protein
MRAIPLISAEHVVRISDLLGAIGVPADRYLERAGDPAPTKECVILRPD